MVNIWSFFAQLTGGACPLCRAPGAGICAACDAALPRNRHACRRCALPLPDSSPAETLCAACQRHPPAFDRVHAPLRYERPVDDLISRFKYHHGLALGRLLAEILSDSIREDRDAAMPELLLPVPMNAAGLRRRGFNQAAELTRVVSRRLGIAWSPRQLSRIRHAEHQRGLKRGQRRRNLRGAFRCQGRLPAHVALVDDVVTTGATVEEISRVLRSGGAKRIEVWAVARTPRD